MHKCQPFAEPIEPHGGPGNRGKQSEKVTVLNLGKYRGKNRTAGSTCWPNGTDRKGLYIRNITLNIYLKIIAIAAYMMQKI